MDRPSLKSPGRGRPRRKLHWVKLYVDPYLFGTTREELRPDERSVFIDLIALAGQANDGGWIIPPTEALPRLLKCPPALITRAIARMEMVNKVTVVDGQVRVLNFSAYNHQEWETTPQPEKAEMLDNKPDSGISENIGEFPIISENKPGYSGRVEEKREEEIKKRREVEAEEERQQKIAAAAAAIVSPITKGELNPTLLAEVINYIECFGKDWVEDATKEAARHTAGWPYAKVILDRWDKEGKGDRK